MFRLLYVNMASAVNVFSIFSCFSLFYIVNCALPHKKFEYKLSFKGPHLVQRDGTIPFWEHGGHAIASDESIRITPSLRSKKGHVWSKNKNTNAHWEVELTFRVSGRGRIGADGLAFWYTEQRMEEGPVFGSADKWNGLAVFFDSFDNDAQHNNPYIMAMTNDGTVNYDHNTDGSSQQIGGCLRDFRNKPFPVRAKVEYYKNAITVWFHNGMSQNKDQYELCLRADNVNLPATGHFGISGATGGLADDHDVQSFLTHSLTPPADGDHTDSPVTAEEKKKFEKEFDEYWDKLQKAKETYKQENPDKVPVDYDDEEEGWFQSQDQKELMNIYEGQNMIAMSVRELNRKMDEIIGRQEATLSQISAVSGGGGGGRQQQTGGNANNVQYPDTIKRVEVDNLLNNQRDLIQSIRDLRTSVSNIGTGSNTRGSDAGPHHKEVSDGIHALTRDVQSIINKQNQPPPPCPEVSGGASNCVTPFYFMTFIALQIAIVIGWAVYRSNKEAASKKFY